MKYLKIGIYRALVILPHRHIENIVNQEGP